MLSNTFKSITSGFRIYASNRATLHRVYSDKQADVILLKIIDGSYFPSRYSLISRYNLALF